MKPLTENALKQVLTKLNSFIGDNLKLLMTRPDGEYSFREKKDRVYYVSQKVLNISKSIKNVKTVGTCIGKFTKSGSFILQITALDYVAPFAVRKVWITPTGEQQFLFGSNVLMSGLSRISDNVEKFDKIVVFSMNDVPLGFGVAARSSIETKSADPLTIIILHIADVGEYIRNEESLVI